MIRTVLRFAALHPGMEDPLGELSKGMNKDFPESGNVTPGLKDFPCTTQFGLSCMEFAQAKGMARELSRYRTRWARLSAEPYPLEDFLWLARQFPRLKIILAHAGGCFPFTNSTLD